MPLYSAVKRQLQTTYNDTIDDNKRWNKNNTKCTVGYAKPVSSRCANERSEWHSKFSEAANFLRNLHFLCFKQTVTSGKLKYNWQSSIIDEDVVGNILKRVLRTLKLSEFPLVVLMGQASRPYSKQGKHLDFMRLKIISSEADPPTLPYIALNERKKDCLAWINEHLKFLARTINIPR